MKVTLSEITKSSQGTNSVVDEAEKSMIWNIMKKNHSEK